MHPDPKFRDTADWLDFADRRGFAHIFAATPDDPMVVHAPVNRFGDELWFHVSRANRIAAHLPGATVLVSVAGPDGYVSPNWYTVPGGQVPTWNYQAVEFDGIARPLTEAQTTAQLDALAAKHEPRVNPAKPWTRDKMDPVVFGKMLRAITGFAVEIGAVRETMKLSQNKRAEDRGGVIAGLRASGSDALADAMAAL